MSNSEQNASSDEVPQPYSVWKNPSVGWSDAVLSSLLPYFMDLSVLNNATLDLHSPKAASLLSKLRKKVHDVSYGFAGKAAIGKWAGGGKLAEYSGQIPFQKNILQHWGVITDKESLPDSIYERDSVTVLVRFPSTLLSAEERASARVLDYSGCLEVKELDLATFAPKTPFLIQFHGGGQIMGSAHKEVLIAETAELVSTCAAEDKDCLSPPEIVTISVDYGLAPEHLFPVAIMDVLSVIEYLLKANPNRNLHLSGESAGANLSLVAGLECFRKYPGRILSVQSQCPMLNPAGESMSYYMNQTAFPGTSFLRWCWRAYLDFKAPENSNYTPRTTEEALRNESNHDTWEEWKQRHSLSLQRLVDPGCDLPPHLDGSDAPKFIIQLNKGDPMFDDGQNLADKLKEDNANVTLLADKGLHCGVGGIHDKAGYKHILSTWSKAVFATDD